MSEAGEPIPANNGEENEVNTTPQASETQPIDEFPADPTKYSKDFRRDLCNGRVKGEFLFQDFYEFFSEWTVDQLRMIDKQERLYLRDALRFHGVYVERSKRTETVKALYATL
jgi:hypothetical protein